MQTKLLCVLIHIKIRVWLVLFNYFYLSSSILTDRSRAYFVALISYLYLSMSYCNICLLQPGGHLLGKG